MIYGNITGHHLHQLCGMQFINKVSFHATQDSKRLNPVPLPNPRPLIVNIKQS